MKIILHRITLVLTLVLIAAWCRCGSMFAQEYHVYEVSGNVVTMNKKNKTPVTKLQVLNGNTEIVVPKDGNITLINKENRKSYKINASCSGILNTLIGNGKATIEELSKKYFTYLCKKMANRPKSRSTVGDVGLTAYRDIEDSLKTNKPEATDSICTHCDSISTHCHTTISPCDSTAVKAE